jgi:hypothetical protein
MHERDGGGRKEVYENDMTSKRENAREIRNPSALA